jgi:polar amino acid transport system substrate-binding protein
MRHLSALVIALMIVCSPAIAAERTLNIVAYDYPPYFSKDLENGGFMAEIIVEAFKRSGHDVEILFLPWKRALEGIKNGKHDGLFTIWYRPEREEWFIYSDPLPANQLGFYKRKDQNFSFETIEDLKPYTIGVGRGYALPPGFEEASLKISEVKDDEVSLRKLHKGRVDLVLTDKILGKYIIDTRIPEAISDLEWLEPAVHIDIQYLVISKKAPDYDDILASFNEGLAAMRADGTLKSIMTDHGF